LFSAKSIGSLLFGVIVRLDGSIVVLTHLAQQFVPVDEGQTKKQRYHGDLKAYAPAAEKHIGKGVADARISDASGRRSWSVESEAITLDILRYT
jgi:hypothetical protein